MAQRTSSNSAQPFAYREDVPASRWFILLVVLLAAVAIVGALSLLLSDAEDDWLGLIIALIVAMVLLAVASWFRVLRVVVDESGVTASFGPFRKHFPRAAIERVEVERYSWLVYAGWGIRIATRGRRAWSVPFVRRGVSIATSDGQQCHVSSRQPERLSAAIEALLRDQGE